MKQFLFVIVLLCLISTACAAAEVTLAWDIPAGQSWTAVKVYEIIGTQYTLVATAPGTATTVKFMAGAGVHEWTARSAEGEAESDDSNYVEATVKPGAPANFRVVLKVP